MKKVFSLILFAIFSCVIISAQSLEDVMNWTSKEAKKPPIVYNYNVKTQISKKTVNGTATLEMNETFGSGKLEINLETGSFIYKLELFMIVNNEMQNGKNNKPKWFYAYSEAEKGKPQSKRKKYEIKIDSDKMTISTGKKSEIYKIEELVNTIAEDVK